MYLGDIDGDGWQELGKQVKAKTLSAQLGLVYPVYHYVIFGVRSLSGPATARLGSRVDFALHVPALAGRRMRLLASTEFRPLGGLEAGGVRLYLGPSATLVATRRDPRLTVLLDAHGQGSLTGYLPQRPVLLGRSLYSIAVGTTAQGRVVKSSLLETEVVP
ncbi:MAG: hypothetical protein D6702_08835 [Planctomycetota bacterium]|nr:MAG: hypothetical protein D6702_08835 [Planctomycetota bacterium]